MLDWYATEKDVLDAAGRSAEPDGRQDAVLDAPGGCPRITQVSRRCPVPNGATAHPTQCPTRLFIRCLFQRHMQHCCPDPDE